MRLIPHLVAALSLLPSSLAVDSNKPAIISFDDDTAQSVVEEVMHSIVSGGGKITHEYSLIKGFAVIAPEKALRLVQTQWSGHGMKIEDDGIITAQ